MLDPVALHHPGFRVPGLLQDARGVVVGSEAAVLLAGRERLVTFLRLLSEELTLSELLPTVRIEKLQSELGAQLLACYFATGDSLLLDRCARAARLCQAQLFVGARPHFVAYRDRRAPLGSDAQRLLPEPLDGAFYGETQAQRFRRVGELPLAELFARLSLVPLPGGVRGAIAAMSDDKLAEPVWLYTRPGLASRLLRYLFEHGLLPEAVLPSQLPEPGASPAASSEDAPSLLLRLGQAPRRLLFQLASLPGLRLLGTVTERAVVELGHAHPLRLAACAGLLADDSISLFLGDRRGPLRLRDPQLIPAERLLPMSALPTGSEPPRRAPQRSLTPPIDATLLGKLRLVERRDTAQRPPVATLVPWSRLRTLLRLFALLPAAENAGLRAAVLDEGLLILGERDLAALPVGMACYAAAKNVLVPLGWELLPSLPPSLLLLQLGGARDQVVIFLPPGPSAPSPLAIGLQHFAPLSQRLLAAVVTQPRGELLRGELALEQAAELRLEPVGTLWPLWGLPALARSSSDEGGGE